MEFCHLFDYRPLKSPGALDSDLVLCDYCWCRSYSFHLCILSYGMSGGPITEEVCQGLYSTRCEDMGPLLAAATTHRPPRAMTSSLVRSSPETN